MRDWEPVLSRLVAALLQPPRPVGLQIAIGRHARILVELADGLAVCDSIGYGERELTPRDRVHVGSLLHPELVLGEPTVRYYANDFGAVVDAPPVPCAVASVRELCELAAHRGPRSGGWGSQRGPGVRAGWRALPDGFTVAVVLTSPGAITDVGGLIDRVVDTAKAAQTADHRGR